MIPVLGVPILNRPDLLERMLASIDEPVERLVIIDNGDCTAGLSAYQSTVTVPPANLGVAASWNLIIKTNPSAPWWCLVNADVEFGAGDLARLSAEMDQGGARWVGMNGDWRAFGISAEAIERVGFFDEGFHPCYLEDCDYEWRCTVAGLPWYSIEVGATHAGSAAIRSDERLAARNAFTYPLNVRRYVEKWGGHQRGGEIYRTPWNKGGDIADWRSDLSVLRTQAW